MKIIVNLIAVAAILGLLHVGGAYVGKNLFKGKGKTLEGEVAGQGPAARPVPSAEGLPEPVRRYLAWALPERKAMIESIRYEQSGEMQIKPGQGWKTLEATGAAATAEPAMAWHGYLPGVVGFGARDAYLDGKGSFTPKMLGLFPVGDASGPEVDRAALLRFLAEAPWYPTVFLEPYVSWEAVDENRARAVITHGEVTADALFTFDPEGKPVAVEGMRHRTEGSGQVLRPWSGTFEAYETVEGVKIPRKVTAFWEVDGEKFPYIRLEMTAVSFR